MSPAGVQHNTGLNCEANSLILIVLSFGGEAGCPQWASSLGGV